MKKIIRLLLLGLIAFVVITALIKSESNGKSFWYNAGHQVKTVVVKIADATKDVFRDAKNGFKE